MPTDHPTWRASLEMHLAQHAHLAFSRFVQVATIRPDGRPANRTLTFRFFLKENRLLFTADIRTEKYSQLATNPWAELCWYFVESRVQMRLLGTMRPADPEENDELLHARMHTWNERSSESRQSFTWPPAGEPLAVATDFMHVSPTLPPQNFGMLIFDPQSVDMLDLGRHPHRRELHKLHEATWTCTAVNP